MKMKAMRSTLKTHPSRAAFLSAKATFAELDGRTRRRVTRTAMLGKRETDVHSARAAIAYAVVHRRTTPLMVISAISAGALYAFLAHLDGALYIRIFTPAFFLIAVLRIVSYFTVGKSEEKNREFLRERGEGLTDPGDGQLAERERFSVPPEAELQPFVVTVFLGALLAANIGWPLNVFFGALTAAAAVATVLIVQARRKAGVPWWRKPRKPGSPWWRKPRHRRSP